jgi:hypothetical protein
MQNNSSVKWFYVEKSGFSDDVSRKISSFLQRNREGKGITIRGCYCDFEMTESLDLGRGVFTRERDRRYGENDDEILMPLFAVLGRFQRLGAISLKGNSNLTFMSGLAFVDGLQSNISLLEVIVENCGIARYQDDERDVIKELLAQNRNKPQKKLVIQSKFDLLMCSAPAIDFDCSCLYDAHLLLQVVAHAAEQHSVAAAAVKKIDISHNCLTPQVIAALNQYLQHTAFFCPSAREYIF